MPEKDPPFARLALIAPKDSKVTLKLQRDAPLLAALGANGERGGREHDQRFALRFGRQAGLAQQHGGCEDKRA